MDVQTYLLHSGLILTLLSIFYWLLLRRETFFKANRWLLLGNILLALAIPLLPKPVYVIQLKADLIKSFQPAKIETPVVSIQENIPTENTSFSSSNEAIDLEITPVEVADTKPAPISSMNLLNWVYLIGFCIMLFRFLIQIYSVYQQIKRSEVTKGAGYYLATNNKDIAPFSFWKYIVINPNKYDETSFIQILEHERIHIIQKHTFDLVIAELFLIVQWFNPLAWWHRHLIGQNLEFLVDQTLLDNGENKQAYQYHLVQVAVPNSPLSISSNYNASQLKNRIKMMNLQRSSLAASWKYALLLPVTFLLLVAFTTHTIPDSLQNEQVPELDALYIIIAENAKIAEIKENQEKLLAYGVNLIFKDLQYDNENKIEVLKTVMHVDKTFGSANWTKEKQGFKSVILYKDWSNQSLGTGFSEKLLDLVENRPKNSKVFVIGGNDIAQTMAQLKVAARKAKEDLLAKQQKLQADPEWKGEWFKESTNFSECSTHMLEQLKMEFLNSTKTAYTFRVNGIEWDETALEIPAESIGAYTIKDEGFALLNEQGFPSRTDRKVTKREINIIRKAQSIPRTESQKTSLEEIYIILTEEASLQEIKEVQEKLLDYGIQLTIRNLLYNSANKIENIDAEIKVEGKSKATASWTKARDGFKFMILFRDWKTGETGAGFETELLMKAKKSKDKGKVFILGKRSTTDTEQFLIEQVLAAKKIQQAKAAAKNGLTLEILPTQNKDTNLNHQPKAKKGYQYFKECDCHIPKTFNPDNGNNTFKIEGGKINGSSSFQVYDRWGEKVYDATPFNNNWNGEDDYGIVLKKATYYFTFQAEEGEEVAQGFFKIVDENSSKVFTDFVHQSDTIHYVIIPCTAENFDATKNTIKPSLFMLGAAAKKRYSSIYLGSDKNKPLFIIRKFDNFEQAEQFRVNFKNINSKLPTLKLLSINQQNYRTVLRQKSIVEYEKFYKEEILK